MNAERGHPKCNKVVVTVWYHDRLPCAIALENNVLIQNKKWHAKVLLKNG
jgi:hypothetical protein